eukprot:9039807-Pyramimonas_sp.AAC.1
MSVCASCGRAHRCSLSTLWLNISAPSMTVCGAGRNGSGMLMSCSKSLSSSGVYVLANKMRRDFVEGVLEVQEEDHC